MDIFSPLQMLADVITYNWLGIGQKSYLGDSVNFFVYDVMKIGILLMCINVFMAVCRYYFPMEKVRDLLMKRRWYGLDYLVSALLGVVTPFCSCSSIPLFIGFLRVGIPLGVTFTFLISSPLVNEASLFMFPAMFGLKITMLYNVVGIVISMIGGLIVEKLNMGRYVEQSFLLVKNTAQIEIEHTRIHSTVTERLNMWWSEGWEMTKTIFPYVVLGVAVGAVIHGYIPQRLIEQYLGARTWWAVPAATLIGVPLYANSMSIIPIIQALVGKGIPLGTALAFMTATVTLSIPEALILKKVMKLPLLITFFGITTVGIMVMGYLFNWLG
jgi:uncharacterized membrane protein YraQ (UPF0718 family)